MVCHFFLHANIRKANTFRGYRKRPPNWTGSVLTLIKYSFTRITSTNIALVSSSWLEQNRYLTFNVDVALALVGWMNHAVITAENFLVVWLFHNKSPYHIETISLISLWKLLEYNLTLWKTPGKTKNSRKTPGKKKLGVCSSKFKLFTEK